MLVWGFGRLRAQRQPGTKRQTRYTGEVGGFDADQARQTRLASDFSADNKNTTRHSRRNAMKVGTALNMLSEPGRSDSSVIMEHFALGDLAEPLGFDSLMALEHHFTGYAMSPAPLQLLAYFAGRTKRITLGTAVVVLP